MYKTICRGCVGRMMATHILIEVEGTETVGQCEMCRYISPDDKPLKQYEMRRRGQKNRPQTKHPIQPKDTRPRYKEPFRVDF